MLRGSSGERRKTIVSRTDENQTGSLRPATKIWPFGPSCSASSMPQ